MVAFLFVALLLAIFDRRVVALRVAGVQLAWTANFVRAGQHFFPVADPANGARQGEDYSKHAGRNADGFQDNT